MNKAKKDSSDAYLALLDYRNTPTQGLDTSRVQRLMSGRTKTPLPATRNLLALHVARGQHQKLQANKLHQAKYYNRGARNLPELNRGDVFRMNLSPDSFKQEDLVKAEVKAKVGVRSYEAATEEGKTFRRNRVHLRKSKEVFNPRPSTAIQPLDYQTTAALTATPLDTDTPATDAVAAKTLKQVTSLCTLPGDGLRPSRYGREIRRPKHL